MDIGSLLLIAALFVLVAIFIARPLLESQARLATEEEKTLSAILAERDQVLDTLQELDFDYQLGKIPEEDYPPQRALLLQKGAGILKQLDAQRGESMSAPAEDAVEAAIAARRQEKAPANGQRNSRIPTGSPDDELEALIAARRRQRTEKYAGFCPQCGHACQTSDQFCSNCGKVLA